MYKKFYILIYCFIFFSCIKKHSSESNTNTDSSQKSPELFVEQENKSVLKKDIINDSTNRREIESCIILMDDFNDSLAIYLDTLLVVKEKFVSDESTGSCEVIRLPWDKFKKASNLFFYKEGQIQHKIVLKTPKRYLYVWRIDNFWSHEFRDEFLKLE
jgi:hypothetical protein